MTFTHIGQTGLTLAGKSLAEDGSKHGATGSAIKRLDTFEIAEWLGKQDPADMDKAAVSRALTHGVGVNLTTDVRFPSDGPSYVIATGCIVTGGEDQRRAALADLRNFETPADIRKIEQWIVELSSLTAGRGKEGFEADLAMAAYSSRLRKFPADVVCYALTKKTWKWFPSWEELERVCVMKASPRRQMIAALERGPEPPEPQRRPPTQEERDRIQAMVDDMFPQQSEADRTRAVNEALQGNCMTDTPKRMNTEGTTQ